MQRKVLALYYIEDMHLREIAEVFGLTESRICQIHAQAILSIRAYLQRFESGLSRPAGPPPAHDHHHRRHHGSPVRLRRLRAGAGEHHG